MGGHAIMRRALLLAGLCLMLAALPGRAMGPASRVRPAQLRYGGRWDARPTALRTVLADVTLRTSVDTADAPAEVDAASDDIFQYPLLWMAGDRRMDPLPEEAVENLRRHLATGGTLFVDDASGEADSAFAESFREELARIFPGRELEPLPEDHAVYLAYYALARPVGRAEVEPRLYGLTIDDRTLVIFCPNDLSGALETGADGAARYAMAGPAEDREMARRLAVNVVLYALTVNYKLDQVHVQYRLSHPRLYPRLTPPGE